ncbi:MAG: methylisocitrate lyase [Planctomycetaceae bacterium]|nr:methylisocitrate lyase [Planctomycetaceae bacterium]
MATDNPESSPSTAAGGSPGARLRAALNSPPLLVPGVFNALSARMAERAGFRAGYLSGAAFSAGVAALPDIGLMTQTEFADQARLLTAAVEMPIIADADTGFGEPLAVERTVRLYEVAGVAAIQLEDQQMPKRCGHLTGKILVPVEEMVRRVQAAAGARRSADFMIIARTDARSVEGFEASVERGLAYLEAGADMLFPEAMETAEEFARYAEMTSPAGAPLIANMTEFGRSPLLTADELGAMGYRAVLYPVTLLRLAMKAVEQGLQSLRAEGTQASLLEQMQTRAELYELLDYAGYEARDREYFGCRPEEGG